ncbi:MAG: copper chaperone PCu(A)C [Pseudomonadota bacterium]
MRSILIYPALLTLGLAACDQPAENEAPAEETTEASTELSVTDAEVAFSPVEGRPAAAYFTITGGDTEQSLTSASVEGAERVELHETVEEDGVASMKTIESVTIGAGETVSFERGGKHVMVFGMAKPEDGVEVDMALNFADGVTVDVKAKATTIGADSE